MRRILVPLDGSSLSATVLDDACRLAGTGGELILMQLVAERRGLHSDSDDVIAQARQAQSYLEHVAGELRARGNAASTLVLPTRDIPLAIDEAANATWADLIACATYDQPGAGRNLRGGIAWRALSHSPVPVLLRRIHPLSRQVIPPEQRHILVPLDGSPLAETALPLALELAAEWHALVTLVQVTQTSGAGPAKNGEEHEAAGGYLTALRSHFSPSVEWRVVSGHTVSALVEVIAHEGITDVVMASHGRTGLSRAALGSVAHELVGRITLPTVVIPASARLHTAAWPDEARV